MTYLKSRVILAFWTVILQRTFNELKKRDHWTSWWWTILDVSQLCTSKNYCVYSLENNFSVLAFLWPNPSPQFIKTVFGDIILWLPMHIGPKRKIQRLLNVIFLNRNFFRPIDTLSHLDSDTMGVHRAARIKIFTLPCPPLSSGVPKVITESPRSKFCASVRKRKPDKFKCCSLCLGW